MTSETDPSKGRLERLPACHPAVRLVDDDGPRDHHRAATTAHARRLVPILNTITAALARGDRVELRGFVAFSVKDPGKEQPKPQ